MPTPLEPQVTYVYGWNSTSAGFERLASLLRTALHRDVSIIPLADYLSREDEVRVDDLTTAMRAAWNRHKLPTPRAPWTPSPTARDLVIRDWLQRHYGPDRAPVKHLVMLAPAYFGSPLAHKGCSFITLGFIRKREGRPFETGSRILGDWSSPVPHTWRLAERDRFGAGGTKVSTRQRALHRASRQHRLPRGSTRSSTRTARMARCASRRPKFMSENEKDVPPEGGEKPIQRKTSWFALNKEIIVPVTVAVAAQSLEPVVLSEQRSKRIMSIRREPLNMPSSFRN